jgi:leader peptidase (prepilin peptidase) / N-methyltransferase
LLLVLLAIAFIDRETYLIPPGLTRFGTAAALCLSAVPAGVEPLDALAGTVAGIGGMATLRWVFGWIFRQEAIGLGDVWLMGLIGAVTGYQGLLPALLLGSMAGSVLGSLELWIRRAPAAPQVEHDDGWQPPPTGVAFGTYLAGAAIVWHLWGEELHGLFVRAVAALLG